VPEVPPIVLRPLAERPFDVAWLPAGDRLAGVVDRFWSVRWALGPGRTWDQEVLTDPCAHLTVEGGRAWVQGVLTRRFVRHLTGEGLVVGAKLLPSGLTALGGGPMPDRRRPAGEVIGDVADLAAVTDEPGPHEGMLALRGRLEARAPRGPGDALVDAAVAAAADPALTRVDELADRLGVTVRTLQRRFERHLGVGPKWVLRRCRIQDALAVIEAGGDVDHASLALRLGFADQAHFTNAFTEQVGVPPGAYTRRDQR
jgi:AraC-like DNA-binding protein